MSTSKDKSIFKTILQVHREREVEADCNLLDAKYRKKSDLKRHLASVHKRKAPDIGASEVTKVVNVKSEPD